MAYASSQEERAAIASWNHRAAEWPWLSEEQRAALIVERETIAHEAVVHEWEPCPELEPGGAFVDRRLIPRGDSAISRPDHDVDWRPLIIALAVVVGIVVVAVVFGPLVGR
jgi:hypothetical protein